LKSNNKQFGVIVVLILLATLSRLIEHPLNFVPISAIILFGAAHFKEKWQVFLIPLFATLISDILISGWYFNIWIYMSYFLILLFGVKLYSKKISVSNMLGGAVGASLIFFIISNFGAWLTMYPFTFEGFLSCYIQAIPFYHNTLGSNLFYAAILFGSYDILQTKFTVLKLQHIKYHTK
tara:strand:+ start:966 stop:1502 length:537 start_codon:yes stop_codon:yes gene_type:complete